MFNMFLCIKREKITQLSDMNSHSWECLFYFLLLRQCCWYVFMMKATKVYFHGTLSFFWNDLSHLCMFLNVLWWKASMIGDVKLLGTLLIVLYLFLLLINPTLMIDIFSLLTIGSMVRSYGILHGDNDGNLK